MGTNPLDIRLSLSLFSLFISVLLSICLIKFFFFFLSSFLCVCVLPLSVLVSLPLVVSPSILFPLFSSLYLSICPCSVYLSYTPVGLSVFMCVGRLVRPSVRRSVCPSVRVSLLPRRPLPVRSFRAAGPTNDQKLGNHPTVDAALSCTRKIHGIRLEKLHLLGT